MKMKYDENMKVGDLVKVRRSIQLYQTGILLNITLDKTYMNNKIKAKNVERYFVHYFCAETGKEECQWANHVEVISSCK